MCFPCGLLLGASSCIIAHGNRTIFSDVCLTVCIWAEEGLPRLVQNPVLGCPIRSGSRGKYDLISSSVIFGDWDGAAQLRRAKPGWDGDGRARATGSVTRWQTWGFRPRRAAGLTTWRGVFSGWPGFGIFMYSKTRRCGSQCREGGVYTLRPLDAGGTSHRAGLHRGHGLVRRWWGWGVGKSLYGGFCGRSR